MVANCANNSLEVDLPLSNLDCINFLAEKSLMIVLSKSKNAAI